MNERSQTVTEEALRLLDYLFGEKMGGLYPIEEDRDYIELGEIYREDE
jgi:hypothetical protein